MQLAWNLYQDCPVASLVTQNVPSFMSLNVLCGPAHLRSLWPLGPARLADVVTILNVHVMLSHMFSHLINILVQ